MSQFMVARKIASVEGIDGTPGYDKSLSQIRLWLVRVLAQVRQEADPTEETRESLQAAAASLFGA